MTEVNRPFIFFALEPRVEGEDSRDARRWGLPADVDGLCTFRPAYESQCALISFIYDGEPIRTS